MPSRTTQTGPFLVASWAPKPLAAKLPRASGSRARPVSPVPAAFLVGLLCLLAFIVVESRRNAAGRVVLLNLRLFAIPSFRNGNIAAAIVSLGEFGLLFALPLWFENVRGYSAFETGIALLPLAIGSFAASGFGAQLASRKGPVFTVRLGIALELAGVAGIGRASCRERV